MKKDPLSKMSQQLNSEERALLFLKYLSEGDQIECERLSDAAPIKEYLSTDLAFRDKLNRLFDMATYWGIEYWRNHYFAATVFSDAGDNRNRWLARIAAHQQALIAVCERHTIPIESVMLISSTDEIGAVYVEEGVEADAEDQRIKEQELEAIAGLEQG